MFTKVLAAIAAVCCLTACGDKVTVNPTTRGDVGESCTRRDDCISPLACIEGRCLKTGATNDTEDGGSQETTSGGKAGESCTKRADCQTGLACVSQTCVADMMKTDDAGISSQGDRGESCTSSGDCKLTLACVAGRCREKDYDISVQPKQCVRVDCETTEDCCKNFVPVLSASACAMYKQQCDSGISGSCAVYNRDCVCNRACENDKCVVPNRCAVDTECSFPTPQCVGQKCVECETKADCAVANEECVAGVCEAPCTRNEQCPLFDQCQSGKCVRVGCTSDRECYFATKDPRSKCVDKKCLTPCESDAECTGNFEVCDQGKCLNVGCESDVECRALLFPAQQSVGTAKAACKLPPAM